jgi:hypothetical protein
MNESTAAAAARSRNFLEDTWIYASRVREFSARDWLVYVAWVGLMLGLLFATAGFVITGALGGAPLPAYAWNVPVGTAIFVGAIAFDTIGHRTIYKAELQKGEALVHHITIFAGITSCLMLCLAYSWPIGLRLPSFVLIALSIFYSMIDEGLHWHRYLRGQSDRVEMWSHFFIFMGHSLMIFSWWQWFSDGYPGVRETLLLLPSL